MDLLLGPMATDWVLVVASDYTGLLLAILPPGAFIITGLLIAAKNVIDARIEKANKSRVEVQTGSKRVRVTGKIA
ncbi:MAG: electron transport complex subunit RsxE, partial [Pseudomonadota bacterium]|nr:electron transport complex subunit RsxE [Pseudomonadota bacterium]